MSHPVEKRAQIRDLYVHRGLNLAQAARSLSVDPRTAGRWKREAVAAGDDWDKAKAAGLLAGEGAEAVSRQVLEGFLAMFQDTLKAVQGLPDIKALEKTEAMASLADAYAKVTKSIQRSAPELNRLAIASEVITAFGKFVRERYPQAAAAFLEALEPFGAELVKLYG